MTFTDNRLTAPPRSTGTPATGTAGTIRSPSPPPTASATPATQAFTLTVNGNNPPTLDAIADPGAITEDAAQQTVNFTGITAGTGETQTMLVTATSNNTALIPNPTVTYTSPNTDRFARLHPGANVSGTATITVTVTDNGFDNTPGNGRRRRVLADLYGHRDRGERSADAVAIGDPAAINEDAPLQTVNLLGITAGPHEAQPLR